MAHLHPLAKYMEENGLTHAALAKRVGVTRPTITKVLSGARKRFSPDVAKRIGKLTGLTLHELLFGRAA